MKKELPKAYEPKKYEDEIYEKWEKSGFFNPDKLNLPKDAKTYSIVLPPPNVTGTLHMGHAAMLAIEDILIRYHRMKGYRTLWVPGTDHAAIATQTKVEKILKEEGTDRHKLGREKFLKRVEKFAQQSHDTIVNQVKKMGASCDWSREAYTLDETRHKAVYSVFKLMYEDGLIYRGKRIVNWCPRCHSVLADDEVEYKEKKGKLYWLKYGPFVLATARPETKLGDTAVAVHPDDKRYKKMVGKKYMIPGVLGEFEITVVADKSVDPDFGSGAIKVTPAHSFIDNEIAAWHGIGMKQIINEDGKMMDNCGKYAGMTTLEARVEVVKDMDKMGLIDHIEEDYIHNISI
ncbi:valine--tRNA ligase, partial [Candidatus Falkowbacteria bacterium]